MILLLNLHILNSFFACDKYWIVLKIYFIIYMIDLKSYDLKNIRSKEIHIYIKTFNFLLVSNSYIS